MIQKFTTVFGLLLVFVATSVGNENEAVEIEQKPTQAPFANYWDAEAWEKGSTDNFWRASSESSRQIAPKRDVATEKQSKVWQRSK